LIIDATMSRKKGRLINLEVDPEQFAIIVHYATEVHHFDESGALIGQETHPGKKAISIPRGLQQMEIRDLALELVEKCKYIPASRLPDVEDRLQQLMGIDMNGSRPQARHGGAPSDRPSQQHPDNRAVSRQQRPQVSLLPDAELRFVDDYQDQLYEDVMEHKVFGAKCILRVCTDPAGLELIAGHDTLLGVLSRELKENSKRSFELSIAIVCTFLCFSHFSQFHSALMQHQCGNVIMRVFEYESERHQVRKQDMDRRIMRFQELGAGATAEDKRLLAKDEKKYKIQLSRQNKLMHVALMALLNLAEEIAVEKKMVNRKMPQLLTQVLDRPHEDLLLVALQFMAKLSVFEENKDNMNTPETLAWLVQLGNHGNMRIGLLALRVLYNFSFDEQLRNSLLESGIVKLLVDLLRNPPYRHMVLRLLYHFSMSDRGKSMMAYHRDGMIMLLQLVVHFPEPRVGRDLVGLVINLATHRDSAEVLVQSGLFPQVLLRVVKTRDPLLCKVIRNVSSHPHVLEQMHELLQGDSVRMGKWLHEFVRMAPSCVDNPDLLMELLGTLANVTLPDMPWGELCEAGLVDLLTRLLMPGFSEDDIVLECVMLVGNLAGEHESAQYVVSSRLPGLLQQILIEKCEDEEIVVQLLYAFQCLLVFDDVREIVMSETDLAPCVMRLACSNSPAVLDQALQTLEMVASCAGEADGKWTEEIKTFRFEQHNREWCRLIAKDLSGAGMSPGGSYYDDSPAGGTADDFMPRWAGATDLAERDWGANGKASYLSPPTHVSIS